MKINKVKFGNMKNLFFISLLISIVIISACNIPDTPGGNGGGNTNLKASPLPTFSSCSDLTSKFKEAAQQGRAIGGRGMGLLMETASDGSSSKAANQISAPEYSSTNIQVQGVDEADIIKTDGKYIYTISFGELSIIKAYPAEESKKLGSLKLSNFEPSEMFVDGDSLLLFGSTSVQIKDPIYYQQNRQIDGVESESVAIAKAEVPAEEGGSQKMIAPEYYYPTYYFTTVKLIDIKDKENPKVVRSVDFEGNYLTARKIKDMVYFVVNSYPRYYAYGEEGNEKLEEKDILPLFRDMNKAEVKNDVEKDFEIVSDCGNVAYFEPLYPSSFITLASISMDDLDREVEKEVIVGGGQNVYASLENLYVAETEYRYYARPMPLVNDVVNQEENIERTIIHKFNLDDGNIKYLGKMNAPGTVLNQFSMDEFDGNFRIATTINKWDNFGKNKSKNNIYIFNEDLKLIGSLEDLAPGETIYSARFMGKRGYLVTFKKVDPFFVIDLSDPRNPKILGKLKIPGFSDYLHPYDENHIIGIGKEAVEAKQGDFAWYQGMKLAIFDVSDVNNPVELHKITIGDRGTDSEALHEHKAFLFDREKQLLVIPITLAEIKEKKDNEQKPVWQEWPNYGEYTFQGAYVYRVNLENGFTLKGRITHFDNEVLNKMGYYFDDQFTVKRSLFIDDNLYTMSPRKLLINKLSDLSLINDIEISEGYKNDYPYPYYAEDSSGSTGVAVPAIR